MKKINYQFKIMSAIAIIAVVAGHCNNFGGIPIFSQWLHPYSFHLPLFAFISGYFYNKSNGTHYSKFIFGKIKKLLLPLFIWNVLYGLLSTLLTIKDFKYGPGISIHSLFYLPLVSQHQNFFNCPAWYIIPLFMCYCSYPFAKKVIKNNQILNHILSLVSLALFIVTFDVNKANIIIFNKDFMTFISRYLLLFPFFHFGSVFHNVYEEKLKQIPMFKVLFINCIIRFILIFISNHHSLAYSICWSNDFANNISFVIFLGSINGIMIIYSISYYLEKWIPSKYYMKIADNTYDIMMHHLLGFFVLNTIIALLSKIIPTEFDWYAFKSSIFYQITPFEEFSILYVLSGLITSFGIIKIKNIYFSQHKKTKVKFNRVEE